MNYLYFTILIVLLSCGTDQKSKAQKQEKSPSVTQTQFDTLPDHTPVYLYTLQNSKGTKTGILNYGGIIQFLEVADRNGNFHDIVLGFDDLEGYLGRNPYFGGIIGRYGNRIANGQFSLDDHTYHLATNNAPNHLHGGDTGFDKRIWKAEVLNEQNAAGIRLTYTSPDGEEGYPGSLKTEVTYRLTNENTLEIHYQAATDQPTIVNLTNHSYFNLGYDKETILDHQLLLNADTFLPVDSTLIPTGKQRKVWGTPFDFTTMKTVGSDIGKDDRQLKLGGGYDHCYILQPNPNPMKLAAELYHPQSGRVITVHTTEPGVQFYSGNFLDGTITGKGGISYPFRSGMCLETQHFPDSPNQPDFPSTRLNPGEKYISTTTFTFSTR